MQRPTKKISIYNPIANAWTKIEDKTVLKNYIVTRRPIDNWNLIQRELFDKIGSNRSIPAIKARFKLLNKSQDKINLDKKEVRYNKWTKELDNMILRMHKYKDFSEIATILNNTDGLNKQLFNKNKIKWRYYKITS